MTRMRPTRKPGSGSFLVRIDAHDKEESKQGCRVHILPGG